MRMLRCASVTQTPSWVLTNTALASRVCASCRLRSVMSVSAPTTRIHAPVGVENGNAARKNVDPASVAMTHARFEFEVSPLSRPDLQKLPAKGLAALVRDRAPPRRGAVLDLVVAIAEHGLPARREIGFVAVGAPVPDAFARALQRQAKTLLALFQRGLRRLAAGNVLEDDHDVVGLAGLALGQARRRRRRRTRIRPCAGSGARRNIPSARRCAGSPGRCPAWPCLPARTSAARGSPAFPPAYSRTFRRRAG